VFSTDHKVIARQYIGTGLTMAVLGGLLSLVMRLHLASDGGPITGIGELPPHAYNAVVTLHATIMVFWVAMPVLVAGFGNLLIPLMVGADDMAFPKLNMLSYWIFFVSTLVLITSAFVPGGAAAGGWTSYPPLSGDVLYSGVNWGINLWILAVALEFVAFLVGGVNFITTTINMRAPGMRMWDLPIFVWEILVASVVFMLSVGPLIAGAVMLLLDRTIGTGFYNPSSGGDPLLFQHLFWFFGHPEVYVLLLPALGILAEVICAFSRKTLFGYRMIIWSVIAAGILSFVVWAHHQFISGIDPRMAFPFGVLTIIISIPFAAHLFCFIATLYGGSIKLTTPMLFALGFCGLFLVGGVTGIALGASGADIYFHDSYYVVAHFHYTLVPTVFFASFAGIYYWFPKVFGRHMNELAGKVHFWSTAVCFNIIFIPQFALGMMGHHRRISNPHAFQFLSTETADWLQEISTMGTVAVGIFQLVFVANFVHSYFKGKVAGRNPWNATTLEWNTPSPPGHGNFDEPPRCYRGPYVYSPPGAGPDFVPQHVQSSDEPAPEGSVLAATPIAS
jgi:cytochrome c oxidase subunit 1